MFSALIQMHYSHSSIQNNLAIKYYFKFPENQSFKYIPMLCTLLGLSFGRGGGSGGGISKLLLERKENIFISGN